MRLLLSVILASAAWGTGVISSERYDGVPAPQAKKDTGSGDIQIGPAVRAPAKKKSLRGSTVPGIYPVYESGGRWILVERPKGRRRTARKGTQVLVIGSRGTAPFTLSRSTRSYAIGCKARRPAPKLAYLLTAKSAKNFRKVGTPIIAIRLKKGSRYDASGGAFSTLKNAVSDETYKLLENKVRGAVMDDLRAGRFLIKLDDAPGHLLARNPNPNKLQLKFDFSSPIRYRGLKKASVLVEGVQVSRSFRRCLRLIAGSDPIGDCAEMPHELMVETRQLRFVAYDPSRRGRPFVLAYTQDPPLWGHERWGFRITDKGPKLFLRDALDPRCRASF
ncbi:MAG: hypothetical protein V3S11_05865 [Elusimicrobiota bacterium]